MKALYCKMKSGLFLVLVLSLVFGNVLSVNAEEPVIETEIENEIEPGAYLEEYSSENAGKLARNTVVRTCSASLAISGSTATCAGTGSAYASMASSVKLTMYLQKYSSGTWSNAATWTTTANSTTAVISKTATVSSGTYRVKIVCTAGGESVTVYSTTKTK